MSPVVQRASLAAWNDEAHVQANRALYRQKFEAVTPRLAEVLDVTLPDAAFYLWAGVPAAGEGPPGDEIAWARGLLAQYNVNVLPGRLLARDMPGAGGLFNPGRGRVRMALVAAPEECLEAAERIVQFCRSGHPQPAPHD
jgi:N-succinyldiaminopimelate aminotransferase